MKHGNAFIRLIKSASARQQLQQSYCGDGGGCLKSLRLISHCSMFCRWYLLRILKFTVRWVNLNHYSYSGEENFREEQFQEAKYNAVR